jgi:ribonuclease D
LRDALASQLREQGKAEWARQEFAAIAAAPLPGLRPDPWRRTSGIHRIRSRRALAVVRELWATRDAIAQETDLSPRRVLADIAIIDAARAALSQEGPLQLEKISGFANRQSRRHMAAWQAAVQRARDLDDASLPEVTGGGGYSGPPPPHRWGERFPDAAARLAAAREAVTALSAEYNVPAENLISPDVVRRVSWEPPDPADARAIAAALVGYGARPWQADLIAPRVAARWRDMPPVGAIPAAPQPKG